MRKNLLIAALLGSCVMGLTACSKGDDSAKPADDQQATTTTAMSQPADQVAPVQTADNSSMSQASAPADNSSMPASSSSMPSSSMPASSMPADSSN